MLSKKDKKRFISEGYSEDIPKVPGLYLLVCAESEYTPDPVAITGNKGKLMSHSEDSLRVELTILHENIIEPLWKFIA